MRCLFLILFLVSPVIVYAGNQQNMMVLLHNMQRSEVMDTQIHGATWNENLAVDAQKWADFLAKNYSSINKWESPHSSDFKTNQHSFAREDQGENIAWGNPSMNFERAFQLWAKEKESYNIKKNSCSGICGHYTQIVWKNTKEVGCAHSKSENNYWEWVVCRYTSAGNVTWESPYNIEKTFVNTNTIYKEIILARSQLAKITPQWKKINKQIEQLFLKLDRMDEQDLILLRNLEKKLTPAFEKIRTKRYWKKNDYLIIQLYYRVQLELYG